MTPGVSPGSTMTIGCGCGMKRLHKLSRYFWVIFKNWLSFMISIVLYIFVFTIKKQWNLEMNNLAPFSMHLLCSQILWLLDCWHLHGSTVQVWYRAASAPLPGGPCLPSKNRWHLGSCPKGITCPCMCTLYWRPCYISISKSWMFGNHSLCDSIVSALDFS